ncbi:Protein of unknown function [Gryllus bimaculatus]|nr:Protein of unknown function [Gryllus bimaculatus]
MHNQARKADVECRNTSTNLFKSEILVVVKSSNPPLGKVLFAENFRPKPQYPLDSDWQMTTMVFVLLCTVKENEDILDTLPPPTPLTTLAQFVALPSHARRFRRHRLRLATQLGVCSLSSRLLLHVGAPVRDRRVPSTLVLAFSRPGCATLGALRRQEEREAASSAGRQAREGALTGETFQRSCASPALRRPRFEPAAAHVSLGWWGGPGRATPCCACVECSAPFGTWAAPAQTPRHPPRPTVRPAARLPAGRRGPGVWATFWRTRLGSEPCNTLVTVDNSNHFHSWTLGRASRSVHCGANGPLPALRQGAQHALRSWRLARAEGRRVTSLDAPARPLPGTLYGRGGGGGSISSAATDSGVNEFVGNAKPVLRTPAQQPIGSLHHGLKGATCGVVIWPLIFHLWIPEFEFWSLRVRFVVAKPVSTDLKNTTFIRYLHKYTSIFEYYELGKKDKGISSFIKSWCPITFSDRDESPFITNAGDNVMLSTIGKWRILSSKNYIMCELEGKPTTGACADGHPRALAEKAAMEAIGRVRGVATPREWRLPVGGATPQLAAAATGTRCTAIAEAALCNRREKERTSKDNDVVVVVVVVVLTVIAAVEPAVCKDCVYLSFAVASRQLWWWGRRVHFLSSCIGIEIGIEIGIVIEKLDIVSPANSVSLLAEDKL